MILFCLFNNIGDIDKLTKNLIVVLINPDSLEGKEDSKEKGILLHNKDIIECGYGRRLYYIDLTG